MIEYITENAEQLLQIAASVIAVASLVATLTPNESDNKWVQRISGVISWLALNVGKAKSK
jgi:choline-glycine betaine transporter|tara:strand:+ start:86 stop:265 length:180 start_codon:yes stop_codon:yes gene_type:complete